MYFCKFCFIYDESSAAISFSSTSNQSSFKRSPVPLHFPCSRLLHWSSSPSAVTALLVSPLSSSSRTLPRTRRSPVTHPVGCSLRPPEKTILRAPSPASPNCRAFGASQARGSLQSGGLYARKLTFRYATASVYWVGLLMGSGR
jgi:hypothetical protein